MSRLVDRLRDDKQDCGPDIDRSCECMYQYTMDEAASRIDRLTRIKDEQTKKIERLTAEVSELREWQKTNRSAIARANNAEAEVERLKSRLEVMDGAPGMDGIYCRDATIRLLEQEVDRLTDELDNERARGIHSCGPHCQRVECVQRREIERLTAKLSIANELNAVHSSEAMLAEKEIEMLREALRNIIEADSLNAKYIARKALEGL